MKNTKFAKISLLILTLALCFGAVFAMNAAAEGEKTPEIISQNIKYSEKFQIMYAVDTASVAEGAVTLNVYTADPTVETGLQPVATMTVQEPTTDADILGNLGVESAYIFTTTKGVSYTEMATNYYAQAVDSQENKSAVKRYSVAEYFYERLALTGDNAANETQTALYNDALSFGNSTQLAINKEQDTNKLISNLRYVTVAGGTIDGYNAGLYPIGSALNLKADDGSMSAKWSVTPYNAGVAGETLKNQTAVTVTDADKLVVEFGESVVITYPEGYRNLDEFQPGDTIGSSTNNSNGLTSGGSAGKDWALVDGHGTVYSASAISSSKYINIAPAFTGKTYDAETSTAFEMSFDLKMNTSEVADNHLQFVLCVGTSRNIYLDFYQRDENGAMRDKLTIKAFHAPYTAQEFAANPADWFNVRMVVYENESDYIYIYINGDTENYLKANRDGKSPDFTNLTLRINGTQSTDDSCYLDNIFVGYTTEANPYKAAE